MVPTHVLDFLVYLWFVVGGLIGAAATGGALGVVVVALGRCAAFVPCRAILPFSAAHATVALVSPFSCFPPSCRSK